MWLWLPMGQSKDTVELTIEPGTSVRGIALALNDAGVTTWTEGLWLWLRLSGRSHRLQAGSYDIARGTSPWQLLKQLEMGEVNDRVLTVPEGYTLAQMRRLIDQTQGLRHDTQGWTDAQLMSALGRPGVAAEGRFFPDSYKYAKGNPDLWIYRRAMQAMDIELDRAWNNRSPDPLLRTPDEALTLASIIEKETGLASDRPYISAVFHNRLRLGMRLQTDPTVIYGMGPAFDGNLKRVHLRTDHPWNTYTRPGLPISPIALPGRASLRAAVQPAANYSALYFVARGDGSSAFSLKLSDHNAAVARYQLQTRKKSAVSGKAQ